MSLGVSTLVLATASCVACVRHSSHLHIAGTTIQSLTAQTRAVLQVRCAWLQVCITAEDEAALGDALAFAAEQGRMKFVRPMYKALHYSQMGQAAADEQFRKLQDTYHPIARKMVAADLGM
jgi:hypothetical protein